MQNLQNLKRDISHLFFVLCVVFVCGCINLNSKPLLSLEELQTKPKGVARDFYIWEYIGDKDTSLQDCIEAYSLVYNEIPKLKSALEKKGFHIAMPKSVICAKLSLQELKNKDPECIAFGLRLQDIPLMNQADVKFFTQKLQANPKLLQKIAILRQKNITEAMFAADAQTFADIFNALSYSQKLKLFESNLKPSLIKKLAHENKTSFNKILQTIILDSQFGAFKKAISKANITISDTNTFFLLGINEIITHHNTHDALRYFELSRNVAVDPFFRDRAIFWQYLISQNALFLNDLQASNFVDIFSIFANQKLKTTPNFKIISSFENLGAKNPDFDIKDPFLWQTLRTNISNIKDTQQYQKLIKSFYYVDSVPHFAYFDNRLTKYSVNYYIMPYRDLVQWASIDEQAMTFAIAKQESNFLPALISRSYALGMMQIMPFNVEPFAKKIGLEGVRLDSMFDPAMAYKFGKMYLKELDDEFHHPLFVAYAYNGGPGFLRRTLEKKRLFIKNRKYEPWLSLELLQNEESRFYGMKVLANYVIYHKLLGNEINIEALLQSALRY